MTAEPAPARAEATGDTAGFDSLRPPGAELPGEATAEADPRPLYPAFDLGRTREEMKAIVRERGLTLQEGGQAAHVARFREILAALAGHDFGDRETAAQAVRSIQEVRSLLGLGFVFRSDDGEKDGVRVSVIFDDDPNYSTGRIRAATTTKPQKRIYSRVAFPPLDVVETMRAAGLTDHPDGEPSHPSDTRAGEVPPALPTATLNVGAALREIRESLGLTQRQAAERAGLTANFWNLVENGHRSLSEPTLHEVAGHLGVPVPLLLLLAVRSTDSPVAPHLGAIHDSIRERLQPRPDHDRP